MNPRVRRAQQSLLRAVSRRRGLLAAGLAAGSVATALPVLAPPPPETQQVLAAARDLAPGAALTAEDVRPIALPPAAVPAGSLPAGQSVDGRRTAGAVRAGEPLTDVRLVGPGLLAALPGPDLVAVPVRLVDAAAGGLLRPGDRVDVLAAATSDGAAPTATVVAAAAPVLAVPEQADDPEGALVVLAAPSATAARLAASAVSSRLSAVLLRP